MDIQQVWQFVFSLADVVEVRHHDKSSFRVRGKIFATVPPGEQSLHVVLDADVARSVLSGGHESLEELWWGQRLYGVRLKLDGADQGLVETLLDASAVRLPNF